MIGMVFFFFSANLIFSVSQAELCNNEDKRALLQIKKGFGNPNLLQTWQNETDCCTEWYQVECDSVTHRIISLTVFSGDLSGELNSAIGDLPYLKTLDFNHLTNVTGPIPPSIAKLTSLSFLRLKNLKLRGSVPSFLGRLSALTFLDLSFNQLSGAIPPELGSLSNLLALHLDRNFFSGHIPEELGAFKGNTDIYLSNNRLVGRIPASFRNLKSSVIDLSRNALVGDASILFGLRKTTTRIDISRNKLGFDLSSVAFPGGLSYLDMSHNAITGSLPRQMTELDLQFLNVSYNQLCGNIPAGGKLQSFDGFVYLHNKCLCGSPLPSCMKKL